MIDATPVRELYRALVTADPDAFDDVLSDDVMMALGGKSRLSGHHRGRDAVRLVLEELSVLCPKLPDGWDVCVSDHHAILVDLFEGDQDRDAFRGHLLFVCAVEDGRIIRLFPYVEDQYAFDRFFGP